MANKQNSDLIDLRGLLRIYLSKWYLFVISIGVCLALALIFVMARQRTYGVRANVLIKVDDTNPLQGVGAIGDIFGAKGRVDDEVYVISSHSLLRDVVVELGLNQTHMVKKGLLKRVNAYPDAPLRIVTAAALPDTLTTTIYFKVRVKPDGSTSVKAKARRETIANVKDGKLPMTLHTAYGDFTIETTKFYSPDPDKTLNDNISFSGYHAAAEALAKDVEASIASKKSNAIELSYDTKNVRLGEDVLNAIIAQYNQRGITEKNAQGAKTLQFIKDRLAIISEDLNDAEVTIEQYKRANNIIDVGTEMEYQTLKRSELETQLVEAQTKAEMLDITCDFLRDPSNAYSLVPATIPELTDVMAPYNEAILARMELLNSARPDNVMLKQMNERIDKMRDNVQASAERAKVSADVAVKELRQRRQGNASSLNTLPVQEREYLNLKREQLVKQSLFTFLLQRNEETAILLANSMPKGNIVDAAYTLNEPLGLGNFLIILIAGFMGLCIPPVYLMARKMLRNKFESREEVESHTDVPVLGEMCQLRDSEKNLRLVVGEGKNSSSAELFRLMRIRLQFMLNDINDKVVLVTSTRSGEGKSFISINLAATLALLPDKRVLLVGMDIRKPQLANYLGIAPSPGLTEYLADPRMELDRIIRHNATSMSNLDIIVAGPVPPNPAELLASKRVDDLFEQLRTMYDYIIVDSAPIGMVSDTFSLNRVSDASVFVTRVNYSELNDIDFLNTIYEEKRLKKLSVAINGTKSRQGYGYGYK